MAPRMSWHAYIVGLAALPAYAHLRADGTIAPHTMHDGITTPAGLACAAIGYTIAYIAVAIVIRIGARRRHPE